MFGESISLFKKKKKDQLPKGWDIEDLILLTVGKKTKQIC